MKQGLRIVRSAAMAAGVLCLVMAAPVRANVRLSNLFGDHMVLQHGMAVPIWGWADPHESITVTAGNAKATATADSHGKWTATLHDLKASDKPMDVTIAGKNTITLHDVLVGDVWVCSGQSNMQFNLGGGKYGFGGASDAAKELPKANHPLMRLFRIPTTVALKPQDNCKGEWKLCTPESAGPFSAVGYFFGRDVLEGQHVPVGLIGTYVGGTPAQSWTSLPALKTSPVLLEYVQRFEHIDNNLDSLRKEYVEKLLPDWKKAHAQYITALHKWKKDTAAAKAAGQPQPKPPHHPGRRPAMPGTRGNMPTGLFNGMVNPIIPYAMKGVIWYQGESNAGHPRNYATLFPTMIKDWRSRWGEGNFPFIWVQLANFDNKHPHSPYPSQRARGWPGLRDAQTKTLKLPNTAQAVIIDIGQGDTIHPKDKIDVAHRLYVAARHVAYGENNVHSGPMFDSMNIKGSTVTIHFKDVGNGLTIAAAPATQPGVLPKPVASELKGFSIAGPNRHFVWAHAKISSDNVAVSSPQVPDPKAVRYAWANNPPANLYNKEGLPAVPFRTDNWPDPKPMKRR